MATLVLFGVTAFMWFLLTPVLAAATFNAVTTTATLVQGDDSLRATFLTESGQVAQAELVEGASPQMDLAPGSTVTVKYDPSDPTLAWFADDPDQDSAWLYTLAMGAFAARLGLFWAWDGRTPGSTVAREGRDNIPGRPATPLG
ncbi:hypothetical protein Q9R29_13545 [Rothia sp. ARF10]|nr:hypothetical protein [Rothia sp. ARF10]